MEPGLYIAPALWYAGTTNEGKEPNMLRLSVDVPRAEFDLDEWPEDVETQEDGPVVRVFEWINGIRAEEDGTIVISYASGSSDALIPGRAWKIHDLGFDPAFD